MMTFFGMLGEFFIVGINRKPCLTDEAQMDGIKPLGSFLAPIVASSNLKSSLSLWASLKSLAAFSTAMMRSSGLIDGDLRAAIARIGRGIWTDDSTYSWVCAPPPLFRC